MKNLTIEQEEFDRMVLSNPFNTIEAIWSGNLTNDIKDTTIIVKGTSDKEIALMAAKDLFKKDVTDKNGCIAYTWGSNTYLSEYPNTVFVYMADVG